MMARRRSASASSVSPSAARAWPRRFHESGYCGVSLMAMLKSAMASAAGGSNPQVLNLSMLATQSDVWCGRHQQMQRGVKRDSRSPLSSRLDASAVPLAM